MSTAEQSSLRLSDGTACFRRDWPLPGARTAVLLVHGLGEHCGRYEETARWFNRLGYTVRGYDQRGHGRSGGRRGGIPSGDALLEDLAAVYADYSAELGFAPILLGHSLGGLVALRAVLDGRLAPPSLILSSPALGTHEAAWLKSLAAQLARWLPDLPLPAQLPADKLSHDPAVAPAYRNDPLRHGWITPRLADFIFRGGASCIADAEKLNLPSLLLFAGEDHLVDASGSRDFARVAASDRLTVHEFDGLYHELLNEAEPARGDVLAVLQAWLQQRETVR